MITVLLVDDHPVVRAGVRGMLDGEPDIIVVGEAGSGHEAVAAARALTPDVVLMDLRMPGLDGVEATARLLEAVPGTRVVVLTTYETDTDILRAVEAGAAGYLLKDASRTDLVQAVRLAARGETVLAPSVATKLFHRTRKRPRFAVSARGRGAAARRARTVQCGDRPRAAHQRGDREDPPAAHVPEARRQRPHGGRHHRDGGRHHLGQDRC